MTDQGGEPRPESPLQRMPSLAAWNGEEARAAPAAAADAPEREGGKLPGSAIEQHPRGAADRATGADASEGVRTADATTAVTAEPPSIAERATVAPSRERAEAGVVGVPAGVGDENPDLVDDVAGARANAPGVVASDYAGVFAGARRPADGEKKRTTLKETLGSASSSLVARHDGSAAADDPSAPAAPSAATHGVVHPPSQLQQQQQNRGRGHQHLTSVGDLDAGAIAAAAGAAAGAASARENLAAYAAAAAASGGLGSLGSLGLDGGGGAGIGVGATAARKNANAAFFAAANAANIVAANAATAAASFASHTAQGIHKPGLSAAGAGNMSAGGPGSSIAGLGAAEMMAAMGAAAQNGGRNFGLEERVNRELVNEEVRLRDVVHAAQLAELQAHRVAEATLIAARDDEQAALVALLKPELASYAAKARAAELSLQKHRAVMSEIESRGLGTRSAAAAAAADPGAPAAAAAAAAAERGHAATLKEQLAAFEAMGGDRETVIHHGGSAAQSQSAALSAGAANDHVAATVRARLAAAAWTPGGASLHGLGGAGNLSGRVQGANDAMKQAAAHAAAAHHAATAAAAEAAAPGGLHDIPVSGYVDAQARKKEQDAMKRRANDRAREERLKSELAAEEAARLKRKADTAARRNAKYNADGNVVADDYDGWSAAKMRKRFKPDACDDADAASAAASSWDGKNDWRITAEEVLTRLLNADEDEIFHKPVDIVALNIPTYPDHVVGRGRWIQGTNKVACGLRREVGRGGERAHGALAKAHAKPFFFYGGGEEAMKHSRPLGGAAPPGLGLGWLDVSSDEDGALHSEIAADEVNDALVKYASLARLAEAGSGMKGVGRYAGTRGYSE
ncbi:uncharacterized protein MICPUCDRAFT_41488 [Micromonas pusilla CCMP1545]|uniref:Predicted protein n=1 Tax=Micromonas pusilla (strain CCMP1545) TaxID=564608 RepID=C1N090_MICPC|nr:uncharacterized protein MICPUCDRAFT_41488 [Micromonas pusilla CCMP1545]EEH54222.1 predicted protein [Micromonas pusilla CCMP1545]|eukprot:XP_003061592.1 predicted protein [Micromonas pusilla CCMP1545]